MRAGGLHNAEENPGKLELFGLCNMTAICIELRLLSVVPIVQLWLQFITTGLLKERVSSGHQLGSKSFTQTDKQVVFGSSTKRHL